MNSAAESDRLVLVVDDNRVIHADFRKALPPSGGSGAACESEAALLGKPVVVEDRPHFRVDCASQGATGLECVRRVQQALIQFGTRTPFTDTLRLRTGPVPRAMETA